MTTNKSKADGLLTLNKDLLIRNAELVKKLNRMKMERDNFEQLFTDWKKINKDASEALNLLQKDKEQYEDENRLLKDEMKQYKFEISSLKLQSNERNEQCNHLLLRCSQYQKDLKKLRQTQNKNNESNDMNTVKFNYEQKKSEMDQILFEIQKLFHFCHANYPQITASQFKKHKTRDFFVNNTESKKRKSLTAITQKKGKREKKSKKSKKKKKKQQRIVITNTNSADTKTTNNIDVKITPELLGPKTSYKQYNADHCGPFTRTQSSQSFFHKMEDQKYRYHRIQLNMSGSVFSKKRDSLTGKTKRKLPRINAIPSSAGNTPLTTPQQSHRGRLSDSDSDSDHSIEMVDEDPHQMYLEMMDQTQTQNQTQNQNGHTEINDLFDMLQQQTLSNVSHEHDLFNDIENNQNNNAQLVPLAEPSDSDSSDSSS